MATSKPLLPAYLTVGEDQLKRNAVLARLRSRLDKEGALAFNYDKFDGETATGTEIVLAANTIPFASDMRLVEVAHADKLRKADSEELVSYLQNPSSSTVVILDADKLAKNTRLYKAVVALGKSAVIECAQKKEAELVGMVRELGQGYGVPFSEGAARKLIELIGTNTVALDAEVKKISLAHQGSKAISVREVDSLVVRKSEAKPWEFVDAFAARDLKRCLILLDTMKSVSTFVLLPSCANRLRELICVQSLTKRGASTDIPKEIGALRKRSVQAWQIKNHATWARNWKPEELRGALKLARECERAIKTGSNDRETFKDWLMAVVPKR